MDVKFESSGFLAFQSSSYISESIMIYEAKIFNKADFVPNTSSET